MIGPILSNIKKRPNIIQNVDETLEKLLNCVDLEDALTSIFAGLKDKSPIIIKQSCIFLQKATKQTYIDDLKKIYDSICSELAKLSNHQDSELRDMALSTLGIYKARVGDNVDKFLSDLNQQKKDKVNEAAKEIQLTKYDKPKNPPKAKKESKKPVAEPSDGGDDLMSFGAPPPKAKKKKAKGPPDSFFKRQQEMEQKAKDRFEEMKNELGGGSAPGAPVEPPAPVPKAVPISKKNDPPPMVNEIAQPPPARPQTAKPAGKPRKAAPVEDSGPGVAKEDAENIINDRCSSTILKQFEESKWQDKKEAYTKFGDWLVKEEYSNELYEAAFWYIKIKQKEWKEKNVNIVKAALSCISDIISNCECMSKRSANIIIPFLSENIGDSKYKSMCTEPILVLSELVSPGFVVKGL